MIALHAIVAGTENPADVVRMLESVKEEVDRAYVVITTPAPDDSLQKAIEATGAVVEYEPTQFFHEITKKDVKFIEKLGFTPLSKAGDKVFCFDKARNYSMDMVPKEHRWLLWLDADDILRGTGLKTAVERCEQNKIDSVFFNYIYQAEIVDGKIKNVLIEHLRERLVRNNGSYKWVAPIHETLVENAPTRKIDVTNLGLKMDVLHLSNDERRVQAIQRNMKALELSIIQTEAKDPRPLYYLGKSYFDMFKLEHNKDYLLACRKLFELYLGGPNPSGWAEERSQCWEYLVEVCRELGEINNAIKCAHNAMIEYDKFPSIYVNLAMCYLYKQEWERALFWVKQSSIVDQPVTTLVVNPKDLMGRALETIFIASLNLSKLDEAWEAGRRLVALYPDNEQLAQNFRMADGLREERDITKTVVTLMRYLEEKGEGYKLKPLAQAIPQRIIDNPFMAEFIQKVNPPMRWEENELAIYCGPGFTSWNPKIMDNPGGNFVGGSEEAVINMAKELHKLGWKVHVYGEPGEEGVYDGVHYLPYFKFNPKDEFNILISWRRPDLVDLNLKAKKIYIWCHDVQNNLDYTPERLEKIHKVMVLSPEHRLNIPSVPDSKVMITRNGVSL